MTFLQNMKLLLHNIDFLTLNFNFKRKLKYQLIVIYLLNFACCYTLLLINSLFFMHKWRILLYMLHLLM